MERTQWLAERKKGIGGSDAAKVLGLSRWGGPLSVYLDKMNNNTPELDSEAVYFGTQLEDFVAHEFMKRNDMKVRRLNKIIFSDPHPFMLANVDRVVVGKNQGLEVKTASAYKDSEWKDDKLPDEYYCQIQHYCSVMDWDGCWIACLIGGQKFVSKYVERNDSFIGKMVEIEKDFWENHILTNTPPMANAFDSEIVNSIAENAPQMLVPSEEDIEFARQLSIVKGKMKVLEEEAERLENELKRRIGEASGIDGIATWKTSNGSLVTDWKALASELNPDKELIDRYTKIKQGSRRFLLKYKPEKAIA